MSWLKESFLETTTIAGATLAWGQAEAVVWGNAVGWDNTIDSTRPVRGDAVVWNAVVWGNSVVSGNGADGRAVVWGNSEDLTTTNIVWAQQILQR